MTRAEERKEWEGLIKSFHASGLSTRKWCAANNVKLHQLRYRLRREKSTAGKIASVTESAGWLPVEVAPESHDDALVIRIGAAWIEVRTGFDPVLLQDVVRVLASC